VRKATQDTDASSSNKELDSGPKVGGSAGGFHGSGNELPKGPGVGLSVGLIVGLVVGL
jgi:hypothetical protein